jgi:uroporphyrinogen decarboxylase
MARKELLDVLKHENKTYIPWVPFTGVHAGYIKGYTAKEVLQDREKLVESLLEAQKLYNPDGMPVVFDLQVEAEILGCELLWADDNPPSVKTHPLKDIDEVPCKCTIPTAMDGRLPMILDAMGTIRPLLPDVALYGLICGPLTLASHLRGNDLLMDILMEPEYAEELLDYCTAVAYKMIDLYVEAGMDIIGVVDPLVSQISASTFNEVVAPFYTAIFDYIRNKNVASSFFVCGNATTQLEELCKTGPDNLSIDENVDIKKAKETTDRYGIVIGGNIPLTTTMLHGNQMDNMQYVSEMMEMSGNYIVSPGCDMPYNTPIENVIAAGQAVKQPEATKAMLENYVKVEEEIEVELPDYANLKKPLLEAFTLDSASCAACTYMWGAVLQAKEEFKDKIDIVEYKYTIKENIARCKKIGVTNLPSLYINGELKWSSIIPNKQELIDEIKKHL